MVEPLTVAELCCHLPKVENVVEVPWLIAAVSSKPRNALPNHSADIVPLVAFGADVALALKLMELRFDSAP